MAKPPSPPRWVEMIVVLQRGIARRHFRDTGATPDLCEHVLLRPVMVHTAGMTSVRWQRRYQLK